MKLSPLMSRMTLVSLDANCRLITLDVVGLHIISPRLKNVTGLIHPVCIHVFHVPTVDKLRKAGNFSIATEKFLPLGQSLAGRHPL